MSKYWRWGILFCCLFECHIFAFCETSAAFRVDPELLKQAKIKAEESMRLAWKNGTERDEQPVMKIEGKDGTIVLAQNTPRRFIPLPDGTLGMSDAKTVVTIIPPSAPRSAENASAAAPAEFRMGIIGADQIQTMTILPQTLSSEQAAAIHNMTETGVLLAQQRFAIEQFRIQSDAELAYLRITRNFTLWGVLVSIPFLLTISWIVKNAAISLHSWQRENQELRLRQQQAERDFKLQELQSAERLIAASDEADKRQGWV